MGLRGRLSSGAARNGLGRGLPLWKGSIFLP